jgi:FlaA1/EpsC-like NDP-sugar epimerase
MKKKYVISDIAKRCFHTFLSMKDFAHLSSMIQRICIQALSLKIFKPFKNMSNKHFSAISIMIHDGMMSFFALFISIYLKVGDEFLDYSHVFLLKNLIVFCFIALAIFSWGKIYKTLWRFLSVEDLWPISIAVVLANLLFIPAMHFISIDESLAKSIPVVNIFVMTALLILPRFFARLVHEQSVLKQKKLQNSFSIPVLLVGDEDPTELFIREVTYTPDLPYNPVGIVTTTEHFEDGRAIHDVPILGNIKDIEQILHTFETEAERPRQIILTDDKINKEDLQSLFANTAMENVIILQMIQYFSLNVLTPEESAQNRPNKALI